MLVPLNRRQHDARQLLVAQEAPWRIEKKDSRYRADSVTAWIHANCGTVINVDPETAALIDFANQCFQISGGLFDITSGMLRQANVEI